MGFFDKLKELKIPGIKFKEENDVSGPPEEVVPAETPEEGVKDGAESALPPAEKVESPPSQGTPSLAVPEGEKPGSQAPSSEIIAPLEKAGKENAEKQIENPEEKFFSAIDKFSLEDLRRRKADLEKMLKIADEELSAGIITESSYNEIRKNAGEKLKEVSFELRAVEKLLLRVAREKVRKKGVPKGSLRGKPGKKAKKASKKSGKGR